MQRKSLIFGCSVPFALLVFLNNKPVFHFAKEHPHLFDHSSLSILVHQALVPTLLAILCMAGAYTIGRWALALFRDLDRSPAIEGYRFGVGFAFLMCGFALLARLLGLRPGLYLFFAVLIGLAAWPSLARFIHDRAKSVTPSRTGLEWLWVALVSYGCWHGWIRALAPPNSWDVLAYHLAIPKIYNQLSSIHLIPWIMHDHWPHLAEIFYALLLRSGHDNLPALLHFGVCLILLRTLYSIALRHIGKLGAKIAVLVLIAQANYLYLMGLAHSDGWWAFYQLLAFFSLWEALEKNDKRLFILAGAFGGMACSYKLLALASTGIMTLYVAGRLLKGKHFKEFLCYLVPLGLLSGVWMVRSFLGTGNPFWPFFPKLFGGDPLAMELYKRFEVSNHFPWDMWLASFYTNDLPILFVSALIGFWALTHPLRRRLTPVLWFLLIPVPVMFVLFLRHICLWRFMIPVMPGLVLTLGWLAGPVLEHRRWPRIFGLALLLLASIPLITSNQNNELFAVLGLRPGDSALSNREAYLRRSVPVYEPFQAINRELTGKDRVLIVGDVRGYYLDVPYMWGDPLNQPIIRYEELTDPEDLGGHLSTLGLTHVAINRSAVNASRDAGYFTPRTVALIDAYLSSLPTEPRHFGVWTLYNLTRKSQP